MDFEEIDEYFLPEDKEAVVGLCSLLEDLNQKAFFLLRHLCENAPLRELLEQGVRDNKVSPNLVDEMFGDGESAGLEEAEGLTIPLLIDSFESIFEQLDVFHHRLVAEES